MTQDFCPHCPKRKCLNNHEGKFYPLHGGPRDNHIYIQGELRTDYEIIGRPGSEGVLFKGLSWADMTSVMMKPRGDCDA